MLLRQTSLRILDDQLQDGKNQLLKKQRNVNVALRELHPISDRLREMKQLDESVYTDSLSSEYIQSLKSDSDARKILHEIDEISIQVADSDIVHRLQEIEALIASLSDEKWVSTALLLDALRTPVVVYISASLKCLAANPEKMEETTRRGLKFDQIALLDLIQYANEVMWETGTHETLKKLLEETRVTAGSKSEWLCGYFRYEYHLLRKKHHHLVVAPEKTAFIYNNLALAEKKEFGGLIDQVKQFMDSMRWQIDFPDNEDQPDIGEAKLLSDIAILKRKTEHQYGILLAKANQQTGLNKHYLDQINVDLKKLEEGISLLVRETEALERLVMKQNSILAEALQVSLDDIDSYEQLAKQLCEISEEIRTQKQTVQDAKKISEDYSRFVDFFGEEKKDVNHRGNRYAEMKKNFSEKTSPNYAIAIEQAALFLLANNEVQQNKFNKFLKKARASAVVRQVELEKLAYLQTILKPSLDELQTAKLVYQEHKELCGQVKALRTEVESILSESKHESVFPSDFDKKVEGGLTLLTRLKKSRTDAANSLASIKMLDEKISSDIKETENYKLFEREFQSVWGGFLDNTRDCNEMENSQLFLDAQRISQEKRELREKQFPAELLSLFGKIFSEEKMEAVWQRIGDFKIFEGLRQIIIGEKTIQVPNDIGDVYNALQSKQEPAEIIKIVCSTMKRRNEKDRINKSMGCLYETASKFVSEDGRNLAITEEKLATFATIIDTTFQCLSPTDTSFLSLVKTFIPR